MTSRSFFVFTFCINLYIHQLVCKIIFLPTPIFNTTLLSPEEFKGIKSLVGYCSRLVGTRKFIRAKTLVRCSVCIEFQNSCRKTYTSETLNKGPRSWRCEKCETDEIGFKNIILQENVWNKSLSPRIIICTKLKERNDNNNNNNIKIHTKFDIMYRYIIIYIYI